MNAEEKREQLLKRILPALVISVIYFVFISDIMVKKAEKAEQDYETIHRKGVSPASLPGIRNQFNRSQSEIAELQRKQQDYRGQLKGMAGFLSQEQSTNKSTALLSAILARHHIQVIEEKSETMTEDNLPPSLREVRNWLQQSGEEKQDFINVQHLKLSGSYLDMYQAMLEMAKTKFPAIPVNLSMLSGAEKEEGQAGEEQQWELILWM